MASWFKDFADSVQAALPKLDVEGSSALLQSLTLTTPALTAERERIDAEEKEKERDRNMLAGLLPWETRDPERDILVEECHDAILLLSQTKATFFGPYAMPPTATIATMKPKLDEHETDVGRDQLSNVTKNTGNESTEPSEESQEKLAKLVPLPPLLQNFDLQVHVGLIERLLREDPKLVQMQSNLSGR